MRKFAVLGMALALAGGLAACSSSSKPREQRHHRPSTRLERLRARCPAAAKNFKPAVAGTLSVVTSLPGPGFWEGSDTDPTKVKSGYEYDIAKCMEADFGLSKMSVRNVGFDAIVAGSITHYDLALSQISITAARAKVGRLLHVVLPVEPGHPHEGGQEHQHARRRRRSCAGACSRARPRSTC